MKKKDTRIRVIQHKTLVLCYTFFWHTVHCMTNINVKWKSKLVLATWLFWLQNRQVLELVLSKVMVDTKQKVLNSPKRLVDRSPRVRKTNLQRSLCSIILLGDHIATLAATCRLYYVQRNMRKNVARKRSVRRFTLK